MGCIDGKPHELFPQGNQYVCSRCGSIIATPVPSQDELLQKIDQLEAKIKEQNKIINELETEIETMGLDPSPTEWPEQR